MKRTSILVAGVSLAVLLAGCSNSSDSGGSSAGTSSKAAATSAAEQSLDLSKFGTLPAVPPPAGATVDCTYPAGRPAVKDVTPPPMSGVSTVGTVPVDLQTSAGPIGLVLDRAEAPCTVNSFTSLAQQGYFDDTPCHRLTTEVGLQVLQCGDPSGAGTGGPGYGFDTEYPETAFAPNDPALANPVVYPRGTVAMANSGQPGSNGSQFFLVYADSVLPPNYTVFGSISEEGLATIEKIAADGDDGSMAAGGGKPNTPVQIETAKVG
ncbi:peptidylprolyl isomerase [Rhodococcus sp. NCIMB 12038]|uniref:peptidylprolyl isomerase n=1 Tax=Rhodococcus sp. NCIMB 12038 TaxID=933800 RepID=UPI000B3D15DC|nr:peptidylprolyl isomerase [Rhodococcus sp. NCIMB 12038]OUS97084.1 peptidyl-prolyl cis-trans isomerase [Rhodococcus sp. NCIMB 12038]